MESIIIGGCLGYNGRHGPAGTTESSLNIDREQLGVLSAVAEITLQSHGGTPFALSMSLLDDFTGRGQ